MAHVQHRNLSIENLRLHVCEAKIDTDHACSFLELSNLISFATSRKHRLFRGSRLKTSHQQSERKPSEHANPFEMGSRHAPVQFSFARLPSRYSPVPLGAMLKNRRNLSTVNTTRDKTMDILAPRPLTLSPSSLTFYHHLGLFNRAVFNAHLSKQRAR